MERVPLYSVVRLKDGRKGTILDYYEKPVFAYGIELTSKSGDNDAEWKYEIFNPDMIAQVLWVPPEN